MNRRSFFASLFALPILNRFKRKQVKELIIVNTLPSSNATFYTVPVNGNYKALQTAASLQVGDIVTMNGREYKLTYEYIHNQ